MSPIIAIFDYCQFEDVPKDMSETYGTIKKFHGEKFADMFTYEVEIELSAADDIRTRVHSD